VLPELPPRPEEWNPTPQPPERTWTRRTIWMAVGAVFAGLVALFVIVALIHPALTRIVFESPPTTTTVPAATTTTTTTAATTTTKLASRRPSTPVTHTVTTTTTPRATHQINASIDAGSSSPGEVMVSVTVTTDADHVSGTIYGTSSSGNTTARFAGPVTNGTATFNVTLALELPASVYAVVVSSSGTVTTSTVPLS
jgi:hypothetical protein